MNLDDAERMRRHQRRGPNGRGQGNTTKRRCYRCAGFLKEDEGTYVAEIERRICDRCYRKVLDPTRHWMY